MTQKLQTHKSMGYPPASHAACWASSSSGIPTVGIFGMFPHMEFVTQAGEGPPMEVRQAQIPLPQRGWGTKQTTMESGRLEKPSEITSSNCSHSTALAITPPCPQVPHPEGWGLHPWAAVPGLGFLFRCFLRSSPNSGPRPHWLHVRP